MGRDGDAPGEASILCHSHVRTKQMTNLATHLGEPVGGSWRLGVGVPEAGRCFPLDRRNPVQRFELATVPLTQRQPGE